MTWKADIYIGIWNIRYIETARPFQPTPHEIGEHAVPRDRSPILLLRVRGGNLTLRNGRRVLPSRGPPRRTRGTAENFQNRGSSCQFSEARGYL